MNASRPTRSRASGSITSASAVAVCVGICLGALAFLIPNRDQLFQRLITDGDAGSAAKLVASSTDTDDTAVITTLTNQTLQLCHANNWSRESVEVLNKFLRNTGDLEPITAEILRHADTIPPAPRVIILGTLVKRSLAEGALARAETLQLRLLDATDTLTPDIVRQAVTTFRYNNNPVLALDTIDRFEAQGQAIPVDLYETRITLARETSRPDIAFRLLSGKIDATTDPAAVRQLVPNAIRTGIEAGQQDRLIPLYQRYLAATPDPDGDPLHALYTFRLAQTYEWTKRPDEAFDAYLGLARRGHRDSLERCRLLSIGLFRSADLLDALLAGRHHYEDDDELLLLLARLLAESARHDEAVAAYCQFLERNPGHADSHYRLALVHDEALEFQDAYECFQRALAIQPDRTEYLLGTARTAAALNRHEDALPLLRKLAESTRDIEHAERFHVLAVSLADAEAIKHSLRLLIDLEAREAIGYTIYLAGIEREEGRLDLAARTLARGVSAFPDNINLPIELAGALMNLKQPAQALEVLTQLSLHDHPSVGPQVVSALLAHPGPASELRRLLQHFGPALDQHVANESLVDLAELHQKSGNLGRARSLFQRATRHASDPGQLARAWFQLGEAKTARKFQVAHINNSPQPASDDYQFLGDILERLNQSAEAKTAYLHALSLLKTETAQR